MTSQTQANTRYRKPVIICWMFYAINTNSCPELQYESAPSIAEDISQRLDGPHTVSFFDTCCIYVSEFPSSCPRGNPKTLTKFGTIQRRLAWPLRNPHIPAHSLPCLLSWLCTKQNIYTYLFNKLILIILIRTHIYASPSLIDYLIYIYFIFCIYIHIWYISYQCYP